MPGFVAMTVLTRSSDFATGWPLNSTMTSPGSMPALSAAPPGATVDTMAPAARLEAEVRERFAVDRRDRDADAPAHDLALSELRQQLAHGVARHREADADVSFRLDRW